MNPKQNPQDYDEVTRLRLRINELELQRDAFAAALRKEVLAIIRDVFTENASLKAEVERLTKAVASSPVAQFRLKELEGKTTFDEINPKEGQP